MSTNERTVTPWLRYSFERIGAWVHKIQDQPIPPVNTGFRRIPLPRPFDFAVCFRGRFVAVELKFQRGYKAFGRRHLTDSQVEHLQKIHDEGGSAWVALVVWEPRTYCRLLLWHWPTFPDESIKKWQLEQFTGIDRSKDKETDRYYWDLQSWVSYLDALEAQDAS